VRLIAWSVTAVLMLVIVPLYVTVSMTGRDSLHIGIVFTTMLFTLSAVGVVVGFVDKRIGMIEEKSVAGAIAAIIGWLMFGIALLALCVLAFLSVVDRFPL
jgi:hypothetical protein